MPLAGRPVREPIEICNEGDDRRGLKPLAEGIAIILVADAIIAALLFAARVWNIL
jgi:hypothetical protein